MNYFNNNNIPKIILSIKNPRIYIYLYIQQMDEQTNNSSTQQQHQHQQQRQQQMQSQQQIDLTQLKKKIQLSNAQLLQLTYNDDRFNNYINELNSKGVQCVVNQEYQQAKILEYAASCGKTIDRSVIVVVLHNQACINQKLWDLEKSANYLQAILYNIKFYFENQGVAYSSKQLISSQDDLNSYCQLIHKKQMYALYYLQFCAVNSQTRKHAISLNSAKTAITVMKQVCQQSFILSQKIIYQDLDSINQARQNAKTLKQLMSLSQELTIHDYQKYFQAIQQLMAERARNISGIEDQYKNVRAFSIGKLMQLTPFGIQDMQCKLTARDWVQKGYIILLALYLGVCYFTVGTELRFISSQNSEQGNQVYKLSEDFLISEVYHVYAIMIVLKYVPVKSIFLNHLLTSFNTHYEIDLDKFVNNPSPEARPTSRPERRQQQVVSYANSQQLPLGASVLPQQSSIKAQNLKSESQPINSINNINKPQNLDKNQPKKCRIQFHEQKLQPQNKNQSQIIYKQKSPKNILHSRQQKQKKIHKKNKNSQSGSRSRSRRQNYKNQTQIHIPKKFQSWKYESSLKNKSNSKTKSDLYNNATNRRSKKSVEKFCIYTTIATKDIDRFSREKSSSRKKSKSKQKISNKKQNQKNIKQADYDLNHNQESKKKSRQKSSSRNVLGKLSKKSPSQKRKNPKSKSKTKLPKEKISMNKISGVKFSKIRDK